MGGICGTPIQENQRIRFDIGQTTFPKGVQPDNYVKTTRYSPLTFIFLALYENFQRLANIYFLAVALVSLFPWSPVTPFITITPLVFVLAVSMIKSLIEDLGRFKKDRQVNGTKFEVFGMDDLRKSRIHQSDQVTS